MDDLQVDRPRGHAVRDRCTVVRQCHAPWRELRQHTAGEEQVTLLPVEGREEVREGVGPDPDSCQHTCHQVRRDALVAPPQSEKVRSEHEPSSFSRGVLDLVHASEPGVCSGKSERRFSALWTTATIR
nr:MULTISPECIES: hypothetical protein [unclassified Aeromicrobium]